MPKALLAAGMLTLVTGCAGGGGAAGEDDK